MRDIYEGDLWRFMPCIFLTLHFFLTKKEPQTSPNRFEAPYFKAFLTTIYYRRFSIYKWDGTTVDSQRQPGWNYRWFWTDTRIKLPSILNNYENQTTVYPEEQRESNYRRAGLHISVHEKTARYFSTSEVMPGTIWRAKQRTRYMPSRTKPRANLWFGLQNGPERRNRPPDSTSSAISPFKSWKILVKSEKFSNVEKRSWDQALSGFLDVKRAKQFIWGLLVLNLNAWWKKRDRKQVPFLSYKALCCHYKKAKPADPTIRCSWWIVLRLQVFHQAVAVYTVPLVP